MGLVEDEDRFNELRIADDYRAEADEFAQEAERCTDKVRAGQLRLVAANLLRLADDIIGYQS